MKEATEIEALAYMYFLSEVEAKELYNLLKELRGKYFKDTGELSRYIVKNGLGLKYPNITGTVKMEDKSSGHTWNFEGGFSDLMYKRIKSELELNDCDSSARSTGFKSYKDS